MIKIAITGNIGSGKSTITQIFENCGDPIFNADDIITDIYKSNPKFYNDIHSINPELTSDKSVSKQNVIAYLKENPDFLQTLERLLYPILRQERHIFIAEKQAEEYDFIVCEVPLLFEKNMQHDYDKIILIHADKEIRWERVKSRPHMTREKFDFICANQENWNNIKDKANLIINSDQDLEKITLDILSFRKNNLY